MELAPGDGGVNSKFTFNPTNKVIGIIDDAGDAKAVLCDLRAGGFTSEEVELLTDEDGARQIDPTGEGRGVLVHTIRSTRQPR